MANLTNDKIQDRLKFLMRTASKRDAEKSLNDIKSLVNQTIENDDEEGSALIPGRDDLKADFYPCDLS